MRWLYGELYQFNLSSFLALVRRGGRENAGVGVGGRRKGNQFFDWSLGVDVLVDASHGDFFANIHLLS